ncbi:tail-anchored protein insertion receptor WRB [Strongylocentrotus purpuratus]|uniref:Guided entry of tail-anchored proteins factor 1 n=1 Tax=Strongylocentrotus purpuratus TaxID=7668 RepID=A0A7M7GJ92_STRPU|nr:tail-anchored protein insertion receptor WRB [Strongylocentrotus purpuratus]|eukprot:XP_003730057.2 PREDICTED: tail-anchored protein insertion receptor WRB [Strongylocentrotus purpuratus]
MSSSIAVFVLIYVAIVHTYRLYIPAISKLILKKLKLVSAQNEDKRKALQDLLDQQSEIDMKEEFAKYAKIERKIIKLKEELKSLKKSQVATRFTVSWGITLALNTIYSVFMIGLIWSYRYEPVILLEEEWAWPFGRILAFPCGIPGAVGITAWLAVCSAMVARLQGSVQYFFLGDRTSSKTS